MSTVLRRPASRALNADRAEQAALIAITCLALLLRLTSITRSLFVDEAYSLALAQRGFGHMVLLFGWEPNGMPYSIVLWPLIRVFGDGVVLLRLPALLAGVASVPALWWAARRLGARSAAAILAALLLAVNPMAVWYSQTARPYAFVMLTVSLAFGCLARALEEPRRHSAWVGYVAAMAGLAYSNLLAAPIALPAQALLVRRSDRSTVRRWIWSLTWLLACCVPLLVAAGIARSRRNALYWLPKLSRELVELGLQEFTAGFSGLTSVRWLTVLAGAILLVAAILRLRAGAAADRRRFAVVAAWGVIPGTLLLLVSAVEPVFWPRYAIVALPGLCLLAGLSAASAWSDRRLAPVAAGCVAAMLALACYADASQTHVLQEEWRPIAAWLRHARRAGQPTIIDKALVLPSLGYYDPAFRARDGALVVQEWHDRPLPQGFVGYKDPGGYGNVPVGPPTAQVAARLARASGGTIWLVFAKVETESQGNPMKSPATRWAEHHCHTEVRRSIGVQAVRATDCRPAR